MYDTPEAMAHSIIALNPSLSGKGRLWQAILGVRASSTFAQWIVALQSHVTRRIHETSTAQKTPKTQKEVSLILPMLGLLCRKFSSILRIAWFPVSSSKILAFVFFSRAGEERNPYWISVQRGWHYSGNQTCATDAGCTCEANELECKDVANVVVGSWFSRGANKNSDCVKLKWAVVSFAVYSKVYWICFGMKNYPYE